MWYGSTTSTFCGTPEFMAPEVSLVHHHKIESLTPFCRFFLTRNTAVPLTGGPLVCSFTRCCSSNHRSVVKTKTKSTMPFLPTNPSTPFTCRATRYLSSRNCSHVSLRCVLDLDRPMPKRLCHMLSSETSTGTTSTTSEYNRHLRHRLRAQRILATSIPSLQVSHLCLRLCSLVRCPTLYTYVLLLLTTHLVLSQAMQEEFRGFSYSADFA